MARARPLRQYFHVETNDSALAGLLSGDHAACVRWLLDEVKTACGENLAGALRIRDRPSLRWEGFREAAREVVVSLDLAHVEAVHQLRHTLSSLSGMQLLGMGADLPVRAFDTWLPGAGVAGMFGTEAEALAAIDAAGLGAGGTNGARVNAIVFDFGLDPRMIPAANRGANAIRPEGGWAARPDGAATPVMPWSAEAGHGTMVARNLLRVAGAAHLWDVPFLPPAIGETRRFLSEAHEALSRVLRDIAAMRDPTRDEPGRSDRWVMVHAWGIYDRRGEHPLGDYSENRHLDGHPFNRLIRRAEAQGIDIVFAAGNAGPFAPHRRCGPDDWGPGRGIWGANAHDGVLSVGAMRSDGRRVGYSSHGPGPEDGAGAGMLLREKPDLCAPSNFCDAASAALVNSGSSAACGVAAGVVAALRGRFPPAVVPPAALRDALRATASAGAWDPAVGYGMIDAGAALRLLAETTSLPS